MFTVYLLIVLDEKGRKYEELLVVSKMGMFGDNKSSKKHWDEHRFFFNFFFPHQSKCTFSGLNQKPGCKMRDKLENKSAGNVNSSILTVLATYPF